MKTLITLLLCALSVASVVAYGSTEGVEADAQYSNVQIANPIVEHATMEEAAEAVGFTLVVPDSLEGYTLDCISTIDNALLQVLYKDGDNEILIRKAVGTEDISGDYNHYDEMICTVVDDLAVTTKGNDGNVFVAVWTDGNYTFAIDLSGEGMSQEEIIALVQTVA